MDQPLPADPSEAELRQLLLDHRAILDNVWVGIAIVRNQRFERLNRRFADLLGYAPSELAGAPAVTVFPSPEAHAEPGQAGATVPGSGASNKVELALRRKDATTLWCKAIGQAVDPADNSCGTIWIIDDVEASRAAGDQLRRALAEQQAIWNSSSLGIVFTRDRKVIRYNPRIAEMFGIGNDSAIGEPARTFFPSDQTYEALAGGARSELSEGRPFETELELRRADGRTFWTRINGYVLFPDDPEQGTVWIIEDIGKRRLAEEELRQTTMLHRAILASASHMIIATTCDGRVQTFNPAAEYYLGYSGAEVVGLSTLASFIAPSELLGRSRELALKNGGVPPVGSEALFFNARSGFDDEREWTFVRKDGGRFPVALSITPLKDADQHVTGFLAIGADITDRRKTEDMLIRARNELEQRVQVRTQELLAANEQLQSEIFERRQIEERMRHIAHHDALTGLANRILLQERLAVAIERAQRSGQHVVVLFIDLDRFKTINDSLGHAVGDQLLREVGARLRSTIREEDFVARIGGDEFVVVLNDMKVLAAVPGIAEKLLRAFNAPFPIGTHELTVSASIGVCTFPEDGLTVDALMRNADTAMYQAKSRGRANYLRFETAMNQAASRHFQLENAMRRALERNELELDYQPVFDATRNAVVGVEALLRWNHPDMGRLQPGNFIHIAEESGLIVPIGDWVIAQALRDTAAWRRMGLAPVPVAVNLSARQFWQPALVRRVSELLTGNGLAPDSLELEITESTVMQQVDQALAALLELNELGVTLGIDDFGTGYSSLAYLKRFPVDTLKIDRTFVQDVDRDPDDAAIVSAILGLGKSLQLAVVAEGVETPSQRQGLIDRGCVRMQGFLFCRPMPAAALVEFLRTLAGSADPARPLASVTPLFASGN